MKGVKFMLNFVNRRFLFFLVFVGLMFFTFLNVKGEVLHSTVNRSLKA